MTLLVLMGIKKEDKSRICFVVAEGTAPVEGEHSELVATLEEDYGNPYSAGEQLANRLFSAGADNSQVSFYNGWSANGVYSKAEEIFPFDTDRFKRGFTETFRKLRYPLDRRA